MKITNNLNAPKFGELYVKGDALQRIAVLSQNPYVGNDCQMAYDKLRKASSERDILLEANKTGVVASKVDVETWDKVEICRDKDFIRGMKKTAKILTDNDDKKLAGKKVKGEKKPRIYDVRKMAGLEINAKKIDVLV